MKFSAIYCNRPDIFPRINFATGLNVVFANITDPAALFLDAHNLGKTFLIHVLDFGLLKRLDKEHAFQKKRDRFGQFVFYLEVLTNSGRYVTIRRSVAGRKSVFIHVAEHATVDLSSMPDDQWLHQGLSVDAGRALLNELLGLEALAEHGYDYRKGLGYVLREQGDYSDAFAIARFGVGRDIDWKPYVGMLLGFKDEVIRGKYEADAAIEEMTRVKGRLETIAQARSEEYDEIGGRLAVVEATAARMRGQIDSFSFKQAEADLSTGAAEEIEGRVADLNEERYSLEYQREEVDRSLKAELGFDVAKVKRLFEELSVALPEQLCRSYEGLVEFNRQISSGRRTRLEELRLRVSARLEAIEKELGNLDSARQVAVRVLKERKTLEKYKLMQAELAKRELEVQKLRSRLVDLDRVASLEEEISALRSERDRLAQAIAADVRHGNDTYRRIRGEFSALSDSVLGVPAILSVRRNANANLEFNTALMAQAGETTETMKDRGHSYKKLLCAFFDLAVLRTYSTRSYYRTVYHDGIFESLDNRKKVTLLRVIRESCAKHGIQYILTVLDTDLPRDQEDHKLLFDPAEIRRELSDCGDEGRLFRMPEF